MVTPISGSWIASSAPPHKKHPAASSGYFSLHCGQDFMETPSLSSLDRLPDESHSGASLGILPKRQDFFDCRRSQSSPVVEPAPRRERARSLGGRATTTPEDRSPQPKAGN